MPERKKALPVGIEFFRDFKANDYYYVDKTAFIAELMVSRHYGRRVVILIDEYDVPLDKACQNGYYPQMVTLLRSFLSQALKTNENLKESLIPRSLLRGASIALL